MSLGDYEPIKIDSATVHRVLIDGGSAVNIVMLSTFKPMGIDESRIRRKPTNLVGFSGESKSLEGEIVLPVYAKSVTSYEKFSVVNCPSSYNVIVGRPWLHNVRVVPSTFHQCVKIPTKDGAIETIRGEQITSHECYGVARKPPRSGNSSD